MNDFATRATILAALATALEESGEADAEEIALAWAAHREVVAEAWAAFGMK